MDLKEQILVALGLKKEEQEVNLGWQSKAEDGTIFVSTLDALEVGGDIAVLTEDGSTIPVPAGELLKKTLVKCLNKIDSYTI
jgi:hypothetical protein